MVPKFGGVFVCVVTGSQYKMDFLFFNTIKKYISVVVANLKTNAFSLPTYLNP